MLHAKTAVFDDSVVYVGSFNFNPRSAFLNTEFAVIVHSQAFASRIANDIGVNLAAENSWQVETDSDGEKRWTPGDSNGGAAQYAEPQTSIWRRLKAARIAWLPIEQ